MSSSRLGAGKRELSIPPRTRRTIATVRAADQVAGRLLRDRLGRINRVLTLVWALAFLATAVLAYIAIIAPSTSDWTNWILPIVLIVGAFKFTGWYSERARASAARS